MTGLALLLAVLSLRGDGARSAYVRRRLATRTPDDACPAATVIVPVKGADEGLRDNLLALASLDYPDYELIVTARFAADIPAGVAPPRARVVLAGEGDPATGEKISNLLAAIAAARPASEIFAFADSDGRVAPGWLRALAAPLAEDGVGLSTGYRWHAPDAGGFWPLLRSAWNAVIAGGFGGANQRFAWGGAMAIRRETFVSARVAEFWQGTVSDDFRIAHAMRAAKLRIAFAPGAMVAAVDGTGGAEFLGWIQRQMIITRVYEPALWRIGFLAHAIYGGAMAGAVLAPTRARIAAVGLILGLGMWKGARRGRLMRACLPAQDSYFVRHGWIYTWWTPLVTWVWLYSFAASAVTRTIRWRGHVYRLGSPPR